MPLGSISPCAALLTAWVFGLTVLGFDSATASEIPAAPEDGGPRNWTVATERDPLNLRAAPSISAEVVSRLAPGTLLDNLGCRGEGDRVWCDVQPLGGGPRGYVAARFLAPAVGPDGAVARGPDDSALRAGQGDFDATGSVPCAWKEGQPMTRCAMAVTRAGGGYATVLVTLGDGRQRIIFFRLGRAIGVSSSEAEGMGDALFSTKREADLTFVRFGPERYEIPDAVPLGG